MVELIKDEHRVSTVVRLLRCSKTQRYLAPEGWTEDHKKALTFRDEIDAARVCFDRGLEGIELVIRAPGASTDLFCTQIR
jgi:hypothetical protein